MYISDFTYSSSAEIAIRNIAANIYSYIMFSFSFSFK